METTWRLTGFAAALLVVFALAFGVGRAAGPFEDLEPDPAHAPSHASTPSSTPTVPTGTSAPTTPGATPSGTAHTGGHPSDHPGDRAGGTSTDEPDGSAR